jgi:hypothetical protein
MNSIDEAALRTLAAPLFDLLAAGCAAGQPPFPLGPDAGESSYYTQRTQTTMTLDDFLAPSCVDAADFGERLAAYWRTHGHPDLAVHAPRVARAAQALHARYEAARPQPELSPYVYQMF